MQYQLKTRQVCLFLIAFIPLTKLFLMPSVMANFANEDAWLCAVINLLADFITLFFIVNACKKADTDFFTLLENRLGKVGYFIVLTLYFLYFSIKAIIPISEQKDYVQTTLYTLMPTLIYFLPFFLVAFYFCLHALRVIGRSADIMWVVTITAFVILFSLSVSNADFTSILPIGARGILNIMKGSYSSLTWFGDAVYFMFFVGNFKYQKKDGVKIFLCYLISAVILLIFLVIFYSVFTSIAHRQRFALTEISKYTSVINNIGRFDYLGIMMILLSTMFSLSLPLFFASKILDRLFNFPARYIAPLIVVGIQFVIVVCFYQFTWSIESFIMNYCGVPFFILGNILPIALSFILKKPLEKGELYESA